MELPNKIPRLALDAFQDESLIGQNQENSDQPLPIDSWKCLICKLDFTDPAEYIFHVKSQHEPEIEEPEQGAPLRCYGKSF